MPVPVCDHVMSSGLRCGSPAKRGQSQCHYHQSVLTLLPRRFHVQENFRNEYDHGCRLFPLPLLEDATSIQTALMQVIHAVLEGAIHWQAARLVLTALRTAQRNLAAVKLERAATCTATGERELPSDARQTTEITFPNRAGDTWETSYIGRNTASPAHLNGDLGYREPKIPPDSENEDDAVAAPADKEASADASPSHSASPDRESTLVTMAEPQATVPVGTQPWSEETGPASPLPFRKKPEAAGGSVGDNPDSSQQERPPRTEHSG